MQSILFRLASALSLFAASACRADGPQPCPRAEPPAAVREVRLQGELRLSRHIDPVTGRGAVSLHAHGTEIALDLRQFPLDILLRPGPYVVQGHWGEQKRLVVTEAHPTRGRAARAATGGRG